MQNKPRNTASQITEESVDWERAYGLDDMPTGPFFMLLQELFVNPKYCEISSNAKVLYSLLLNRVSLSRANGWVGEHNKVYVIFTRIEAAETMKISYDTAAATFRELIKVGLLHERRRGQGHPNLLYVLQTKPANKSDESAKQTLDSDDEAAQPIDSSNDRHIMSKNIKFKDETIKMPNQDTGNLVTIKINKKNIYNNKNNISQSVINTKKNKKEKTTDGLTDNYANFFKKIFRQHRIISVVQMRSQIFR